MRGGHTDKKTAGPVSQDAAREQSRIIPRRTIVKAGALGLVAAFSLSSLPPFFKKAFAQENSSVTAKKQEAVEAYEKTFGLVRGKTTYQEFKQILKARGIKNIVEVEKYGEEARDIPGVKSMRFISGDGLRTVFYFNGDIFQAGLEEIYISLTPNANPKNWAIAFDPRKDPKVNTTGFFFAAENLYAKVNGTERLVVFVAPPGKKFLKQAIDDVTPTLGGFNEPKVSAAQHNGNWFYFLGAKKDSGAPWDNYVAFSVLDGSRQGEPPVSVLTMAR